MNATALREKLLGLEARLALMEDDASLNVRRFAKKIGVRLLLLGELGLFYLVVWLVLRYEKTTREVG